MKTKGRNLSQDSWDIDVESPQHIDYQAAQNPYYEGDIDFSIQNNKNDRIIPDLNNIEMVTATQNLYYDL